MTVVERHCRIAVVGARRPIVAKVISLLRPDGAAPQHWIEDANGREQHVVVEYLPCVALFDSYSNEKGQTVRYLGSLEYHGPNGDEEGSSLAPFFDATNEYAKEQDTQSCSGVSAVAVGCGIESEEDVTMIESFVRTMSSQSRPVVIDCILPNCEYPSMKDETAAFRALSLNQKEEATRLQSMGPGKMAKFAACLASRAIFDVLAPSVDEEEPIPDKSHSGEEASEDEHPESPRVIDPSLPQYTCRKCRMALFGEDVLEDPPHMPSRHHFSSRKVHHGGADSRGCESLFLARSLAWMGDVSVAEGKFGCPKCGCKLGSWKWAGAQCSCGTWVTPAIQVPLGKVDVLQPMQSDFPPGVVISPFIGK